MTTSDGERPKRRLRVGVLGSGNIGTDLLVKVQRSSLLEPVILMGRNFSSPGMTKARELSIPVTDESIGWLQHHPGEVDLVFDATSARDHEHHAPVLAGMGILAVDLTPAAVGEYCVPAVNIDDMRDRRNVNMVTCGGQASVPLAWALGQTQGYVEYVEVVSSIAARSAGPATRANLDEYIETTESAVLRFSGAGRAKAILNLNPADPCINMQTTVMALVPELDLDALCAKVDEVVTRMRTYVPGYEIIVAPTVENGRIVIMARVRGLGDYLPAYAGNLDIINCAAVAAAETFAVGRAADRREAGACVPS